MFSEVSLTYSPSSPSPACQTLRWRIMLRPGRAGDNQGQQNNNRLSENREDWGTDKGLSARMSGQQINFFISGSVRSSRCHNVCLSGRAAQVCLNLHLRSVTCLSQVSVSFLTYFVVQMEPKILRLVKNYRVTIKERYKVLLHCEPKLRSSDLLRLLGANQIWSIW